MEKLLEVLKMIPALFGVLKAVEEVFPKSGAGAEKLALVRELMETAYGEMEKLWPAVEKCIKVIVAFFNAKGIFTKD